MSPLKNMLKLLIFLLACTTLIGCATIAGKTAQIALGEKNLSLKKEWKNAMDAIPPILKTHKSIQNVPRPNFSKLLVFSHEYTSKKRISKYYYETKMIYNRSGLTKVKRVTRDLSEYFESGRRTSYDIIPIISLYALNGLFSVASFRGDDIPQRVKYVTKIDYISSGLFPLKVGNEMSIEYCMYTKSSYKDSEREYCNYSIEFKVVSEFPAKQLHSKLPGKIFVITNGNAKIFYSDHLNWVVAYNVGSKHEDYRLVEFDE